MNEQKETKRKYTGINRLFQSELLQTAQDKLKDGTFRDFFMDWKWIFRFTRQHGGMVLLYAILGIVNSTFFIGISYISRTLINQVTRRESTWIVPLLIAMIAGHFLRIALNAFTSRLSAKINIRMTNAIQAEIFDKIIDVKWTSLNAYTKGDILNRFNDDVKSVSSNAVNWIPNFCVNGYTFLVTLIVLLKMDPMMALIALLSAPVLVLTSRTIMKRQRSYRERVTETNSKMMAFETECFYNFDAIKAFGIWKHYSSQLRAWHGKYEKDNLDSNAFQIKTSIWMRVTGVLVSLTAFGYCLLRLWTGKILYGDMTFFLNQRSNLSGEFDAIVRIVPEMLNAAVSARRIRELVELPKEEHDEAAYHAAKERAQSGLSVEMNGVRFGYEDEKSVYEDASFLARPGEIVAVLGESGGGKTTMFRLLLGLVEPGEGEVILRDADGNGIPMNADMRQLISYVPQGNSMIMGTIAENMRMVKEDASDEEIIAALKRACAWEFLEPIGIHSRLGERGRGISEGQAQRLSIARAILRDAPILFLDEATSALDEGTETRVLDNLMSDGTHKTVIVSTHRPSVLKKCHRIYRIEDKKVRESE